MATREQKLAAVYSEGKTLSVYDATASAWLELPGLLDFTESAGERDGRSTGTDSTRPEGVVSNMKAPTVEATFKYVAHPSWDLVDAAFVNKTVLSFRFDTEGEVVQDFAGVAPAPQAAISAAGACTFTNAPSGGLLVDDFPLGGVIRMSSADHPIVTVSGSGDIVSSVAVKAPTAAVSAAAFTTAVSAERVSFRGKVMSAPTRQHGIAQQSEREGSLSIQCMSVLPKPVRISP